MKSRKKEISRSRDEISELRHQAEERLRARTDTMHPPRTREAAMQIVQELEVHQIELEMQNDELRRATAALETSLEKYTDLYDFAPVGYFTLDRSGAISAANLGGAGLLAEDRSRLIGRRFGQFVAAQDRPAFTAFFGAVFAGHGTETIETPLLIKGKRPFIVLIEGLAAPSGEECRLAVIDITERRQAEDALRESEARMYRLTEMAADAIIMLNDSGTVTFCNAAAERMFGCPGAEITHCDFHRSFIPGRFRTAAKQGFDRFKERGAGPLLNTMTEVTALRKDGTEFPLELSLSALRIKGEWHAIAIMRDITERRQLDKDVQDAREYAESIVETVRRPLVVLDAELRIVSANPSFYSTFKVSPAEMAGRSIHHLGGRQWDIPRLRALLEGLLHQNTAFNHFEVEHDFPGIGRKIILLNARRIFRKNSSTPSILLAMEDITERRRAGERISEVMRQQQAILDNIPNIAWLKDREGRYVAVNKPFGSLFGMAPKDLVGKSDRDLYPPELAEKYEKDFREVMETGARKYIEESIVDPDGKTRYIEKTETPFSDDAGAIIGVIGIAHDITGSKELEVMLRHQSTHDTLTGLYNRAFFEEELERFARSREFPLSIVMADVNGLKTVNDTLGHEAGDALLRSAARIILAAFRAGDVIARIGGDEFVVLLPETDMQVAEESVKRIMNSAEMANGAISIAFGIASAENKDQIGEALKLSDTRMYRHKSSQKDRG